MESTTISSDTEHQVALREVEALVQLDPVPSSREGQRLLALVSMIEDFEREKHHFGKAEPLDIIEFLMEEQGLEASDLVPLLGDMQSVSEILAGKRALSRAMIEALSLQLGVPADLIMPGRANTAAGAGESADDLAILSTDAVPRSR